MRLACICPNPAIDHTVVVASLATGETVRAARSRTTAGGKGLNVARFASGLGVPVAAVTWLGETGAGHLRALARRDDVPLTGTVVAGAAVRVCPVIVDSRDGSVLTTSDPPPVLDAADWSSFARSAASVAATADVVCISGSFPRVAGAEAVDVLLGAVGATDRVWFDSSGPALLRAASEFPAVGLKINLAEARTLLHAGRAADAGAEPPRRSPRAEALELAEALSRGARPVIVTAGSAGAAEVTSASRRWQDAPGVAVRNATASGDAFLAAYVCAGHGHLTGLADSLRAGVLAGAVNASSWEPAAPAAAILELAARPG
jgi:fructose-1-phosphate kinase PfkB-like protein